MMCSVPPPKNALATGEGMRGTDLPLVSGHWGVADVLTEGNDSLQPFISPLGYLVMLMFCPNTARGYGCLASYLPPPPPPPCACTALSKHGVGVEPP